MKVDDERVLRESELDGYKMLESYQIYMGSVGRYLCFFSLMLTDQKLDYGICSHNLTE